MANYETSTNNQITRTKHNTAKTNNKIGLIQVLAQQLHLLQYNHFPSLLNVVLINRAVTILEKSIGH